MPIRIFAAGLTLLLATPAVAQTAFAAPPVDDGQLGAIAGRADLAIVAQSDQASTVTQNSVGNNSLTGDVKIDGSAFQNMQGLSLLNVNTGNNVSMNTSMNVVIMVNPGP